MREAIRAQLQARTAGDAGQAWSEVTALAEREHNSNVPGSYRDDGDAAAIFGLTEPITPAAVLVGLIERNEVMTVLLTRRTESLSSHGGQISFPGGRVEPNDGGPVQTALRETEEEIGLTSAAIEVVGRLADYVVGTGYLVSPIVGLIEPPFALKPQAGEVAEVFEAPLDYVLNPENIERHSRQYEGTERFFFAITWDDHYIWGATAGMLRNLSNIVWST